MIIRLAQRDGIRTLTSCGDANPWLIWMPSASSVV